jgi:hypothetical protein
MLGMNRAATATLQKAVRIEGRLKPGGRHQLIL